MSLVLATSGCSKPSEGEATPAPAPGDAAKPEGGEAKADAVAKKAEAKDGAEAKQEGAPPPTDSALAATVAAMIEAETSYPAALDSLLDLVPAGSPVLVVVRDVDDLLGVTEAALQSVDPAMRALAAAAGGDAGTDVARVLDGHTGLQAAMHGPDFALDKGMVVANVGGKGVVIYGTSKPDALPTLLRTLGAEGDDLPDDCKAVDGVEGYAVCASDPETLAKYAPGKAAAALRATLGERLGAATVDRANVLAHVAEEPDPSEHVTFAVATTPGLVHFTAGLAKAPEELGRFLGSGASPALGLAAPGSGFYWGKLEPAAIVGSPVGTQPFVGNVVKTLTGEFMLGSLAEPSALVLVAGVTDPAPAGGLVAMAGMQAGSLPKTLPDGSSLAVGMEALELGGKSTQVLHATLTPKAEQAELLAKMGLQPEAWLFASGGYAGVVIGAGKEAVEKIAAHSGAGMGSDAARALPKPLAQGLVDGDVSLAMHLPVDGLQSPQVAEALEKVAAQVPTGELPPGVTASQVMSLVRAMAAPVSGLSVWMGPPKGGLVVHVALSLMGDARTEEGKAALAAMATVAGGGDPATAWGDVATRYAGSDRATAYEARAGKRSDGALTSAAMLGVLAGMAGAVLLVRGSDSTPPAMAMPMPMVAAPPPK